ncbi:MAG: YgcG family protein [Burkholderiales bacterium]|nr:YgcG family protein [Burkholderiales bacterium]
MSASRPPSSSVRWLAALLAACAVSFAHAQWEKGTDGLTPVPPLRERVTDLTGTLSASDRASLVAKLAAWEQKTGNQLAVLIVPTTQPEPIEAYSIRVAEAWKIGRKGQDNGALLVVAKNDRKMRIEVGYGLEGVLTDVTSRRIIAETIAPLFRQDKYAQGIDAGVDQIIAVVDKGQPLAEKPPASKQSSRGGIAGFPIEMLLIVVFVVVPILGGVLRRIFGAVLGSTVGAGIVGAGAWVVAGSLVIAIVAAVVALIVMLFMGMGGPALARRGGGVWVPTGGGWGGGGGGGGGGFSGGGGGFGGGGASGNW